MTGLMDMSDVKSFLKFDENGKVRDDQGNVWEDFGNGEWKKR